VNFYFKGVLLLDMLESLYISVFDVLNCLSLGCFVFRCFYNVMVFIDVFL